MSHKIEKDWMTKVGLRAVVSRYGHRCGYVGVPCSHPFYKVGYDQVDVDVHGGLTYSSRQVISKWLDYPVPSKNLHWFGFDCGHYGDDEDGGQSLDYVIDECESLASQLIKMGKANG